MASVFKRGETWYVRWRAVDGWTQRATEAKNRSQAKAFAAELELEEQTARRARLRQTAGLVPVQDDLPGSFGALCRWWLDERCPEPSRDIEERRLRKHVLAAPIAALPLARVRSSDLENLLADLERKGAAAGSVNKLRAILHAVFNRARRAGRWVGENPVAATQPRMQDIAGTGCDRRPVGSVTGFNIRVLLILQVDRSIEACRCVDFVKDIDANSNELPAIPNRRLRLWLDNVLHRLCSILQIRVRGINARVNVADADALS